MEQSVWAPGVNGPDQPNTARIRDYWLGGSHNIEADRQIADQVVVGAPHLPYMVRMQRAFLRRAVHYLVEAGVRQFLDLGSGVPTAGNVHEVAQSLDPDCRVAYVDIDPVVVAESRDLLAGTDNVAFLLADLRRPEQVLTAPELPSLLDLSEPVAILLVDVLHFVSDMDDPVTFVRNYLDAMCSGSYLAISHTTSRDEALRDGLTLMNRLYRTEVPPLTFRHQVQIADYFTGLDVVEPGLVPIPLWHPRPDQDTDREPEHFSACAALARKP